MLEVIDEIMLSEMPPLCPVVIQSFPYLIHRFIKHLNMVINILERPCVQTETERLWFRSHLPFTSYMISEMLLTSLSMFLHLSVGLVTPSEVFENSPK